MKPEINSFYILIVCLLVTGFASSWKIQSRIYGGKAAEPGQFPFLVSFRSKSYDGNEHDCGGAILNDRFVLLAAHCIKRSSPEPSAYVVAVDAHNQYDGEIYSVKKIYVHEHYVSSIILDDIAIVEVDGPIRFSDKVQPIELEPEFIGSGVEAMVAGFGEPDVIRKLYISLGIISFSKHVF